MKTLFSAVLVAALAGGASADVLLDYGVSNIPPHALGGCWASQFDNQNFTENVTNNNALPVAVDSLSYWSCFSGLNGLNFAIKVHQDADNDGVPDSEFVPFFIAAAIAETFEGNFNGTNVYRYDFSFAPVLHPGNTTLFWGISGNGFEAAQLSIQTPGNGQMWQYSGNNFSPGPTFVGDMMIRIEGTVIPAPGALSAVGLGGLLVTRRRR